MMKTFFSLLVLTCTLLSSCTQKPEDGTAVPGKSSVPSTRLPAATSPRPAQSSTPVPSATEPETNVDGVTPTRSVTQQPPVIPTITASPEPLFPAYEGPPLKRYDIGVQIHIHREEMSLIFAHLRALNVGWVKAQVSWALYQPERGQYSDERFAELDGLVEMAADDDIAVLLSVGKAPVWSRPVAEMNGPPDDYELFREFMLFLTTRYRGRIGAYELWNEPNLQREWNGAPLSASDFAELVKIGAAGVRAGDPNVIIISGAPAPTGINDGIQSIDDRIFFRDMLLSGIADHVDVMGVHPYGWSNPPDSTSAQPDASIPSHNDHPSFFFQDTLFDYRNALTELGLDKQLWVTEFGWGSFDAIGSPPPQGVEFMAAVSEWQQALYTLRAFELANEWEWVGPMVLWNLNFGPLLGLRYSESGFSLLRPDGSPRPAYLALQAVPKT